MTKEETLKKIIEKAEANGWKDANLELYGNTFIECIIFSHDFAKAFFGRAYHSCTCLNCGVYSQYLDDGTKLEKKKFSKDNDDFGHGTKGCSKCGGEVKTYSQDNWQHHIQQLAISKDRIKYLNQFIK